jgi:hypothetical protein
MQMTTKRWAWAGVALLCGLGMIRAAAYKFREKQQAFQTQCSDQVKSMGGNRGALKAKYPTPEISLVASGCLLPGGTTEVVVKGKFPPGTGFFFENDNLSVVKESLVGNEYRATVKAADGVGPMDATLTVLSPVTCINARKDRAVVVGGKYEWSLTAANGWRVVLASPAGQACGPATGNNDMHYDVAFFKPGESAPFEKRQATLSYSLYDSSNYRFNIQAGGPAAGSAQEQVMALMQKMQDPKTTPAQQQQIMNEMQNLQQKMLSEVKQMTDPSYIKQAQEKQLSFGCEAIELAGQGGSYSGNMRCSEKVGRRIAVNGTMKALGR